MEILQIIAELLGGLAFFLYGMNIMTNGLEKMAGGSLENVIKKFSSNNVKGIALGCGVTAVIQSSSATTVMLVGLVGSGIMILPQTIGIIMGANIGTTITPWITGLNVLNGEESLGFLNFLKPAFFSPVIALIGIILVLFLGKKKRRRKDIGAVCLGFAILMTGMSLMSDSVSFFSDDKYLWFFEKITELFQIPAAGILLAILFGMVFTSIIQSSSASVGVLQTVIMSIAMPNSVVFPIILGFNIGAAMPSIIASIGAKKSAKGVAAANVIIKVLSVVVFLIPIYLLDAFNASLLTSSATVWTIALFHTLFNIISTIILLPFTKLILKLSYKFAGEKEDEERKEEVAYIDPVLIQQSPSIAVSECLNLTIKMSEIARDAMLKAMDNYDNYSEELVSQVTEEEELVDKYEDNLGTYLVKVSSRALSESDSNKVSKMLHTIGNFERLSDHAVNVLEVKNELVEKGITFSPMANEEISVIASALRKIISITTDAFITNDISLAKRVEPLEQVIDGLIAQLRSNHVDRLKSGDCTIEHGFILSDLTNNYERVSDHCSNIAVAIIETSHNSFGTHEYLNSVKNQNNEDFEKAFEQYSEEFHFNH